MSPCGGPSLESMEADGGPEAAMDACTSEHEVRECSRLIECLPLSIDVIARVTLHRLTRTATAVLGGLYSVIALTGPDWY